MVEVECSIHPLFPGPEPEVHDAQQIPPGGLEVDLSVQGRYPTQ